MFISIFLCLHCQTHMQRSRFSPFCSQLVFLDLSGLFLSLTTPLINSFSFGKSFKPGSLQGQVFPSIAQRSVVINTVFEYIKYLYFVGVFGGKSERSQLHCQVLSLKSLSCFLQSTHHKGLKRLKSLMLFFTHAKKMQPIFTYLFFLLFP